MFSTRLLKSAGVVTIGALLGRALGFGRETALAARFGAGAAVDAFQNANLLPVTLFMPIAATLPSALIPVYARRLAEGGREGVLRTANSLLNVTLLGSLALSAALFAFAPQVAALVGPGFDDAGRELAAVLLRWMAPAMVFLGLAAVLTGILQANEHFLLPALAGIPMNGLIIAAILGLSPAGIQAAAVGTLLGAAGYLLIQVPGLRGAGFRYQFVLDLRDPGIRLIGNLIGPLLLTTAASQLTLYVNRILASGLPEGSISYLNYATRVAELPLSIFAAALATVIYPTLSRQVVDSDALFRRSLLSGVRLMLFIVAPLAVGMALLREPVIRILFERGAFSAADTSATAAAVLGLAVGLVPSAAATVWGKGLYAMGDTRSPFLAGLVTVAAVILFSLLLIKPMGHAGLALATSLAQTAYAAVIALLMRRRVGAIGGSVLAPFALRVGTACAAMAAAVWAGDALLSAAGILAGTGLAAQTVRLGALIGLGAAVYTAAAALLRLEETALLRQIWNRLRRRVTSNAGSGGKAAR